MTNLYDKIPAQYKKYSLENIEGGASKRKFYRLRHNNHSIICLDSSKEIKNYKNFLKIHNYISKINVSIPEIYEKIDENYIIILEDFGELRFDKILSKYPLKKLLSCAIESLLVFNKEIYYDTIPNLPQYNFKVFKSEIQEILDYYYPFVFKKKIDESIRHDFFNFWKESYDSFEFNFANFVHKDFNINNLIYLPNRKEHLKCGILDFQNAFWGEDCWDIFSLLEDSRVLFDEKFNNYFIEYYYHNSNQKISLDQFKDKYFLFNCSRQTRLLGRWVKLSIDLNENWYLNFIPITKKRLMNGLNYLKNDKLKSIYNKIIY